MGADFGLRQTVQGLQGRVVLAQRAGWRAQRRVNHHVVVLRMQKHRHDRCPRPARQHQRSGGHRHALAQELDLDAAVVLDALVQVDHYQPAAAQGVEHARGGGLVALDADRLNPQALQRGDVVTGRHLARLADDDGDRVAGLRQPQGHLGEVAQVQADRQYAAPGRQRAIQMLAAVRRDRTQKLLRADRAVNQLQEFERADAGVAQRFAGDGAQFLYRPPR